MATLLKRLALAATAPASVTLWNLGCGRRVDAAGNLRNHDYLVSGETRTRARKTIIVAMLVLTLAVLVPISAQGASYSWSATATTNVWTTPANWGQTSAYWEP